MSGYRLLVGDCREMLRTLPDESVHCVVTSPPYWGLRDYGVDGQLGLEETPEEYVANMVEVFREVRRVLRSDGTLWLNLGDSYAVGGMSNPSGKSTLGAGKDRGASNYQIPRRTDGLKPKDLVGIPWRVAFALQTDGWYLRSDIIWAKPNPMPESVQDRPTKAHEYIFLMSKSARYYYDAYAILEELATPPHAPGNRKLDASRNDQDRMDRVWGSSAGRNKRSVWTIATVPYPGAHFAVFPPQLAEPCILAGTSERGCCPECGAPWERVVERIDDGQPTRMSDPGYSKFEGQRRDNHRRGPGTTFSNNPRERTGGSKTTGWRPTCECNAGDPVPCTVLDPFAGSGTTGMVATGHGRRAILIELNPDYAELIRERIGPMLEEEVDHVV